MQNVLVDDCFDAVEALGQYVHSGTVREAHKVVARRVEQVTTARGVQIEEDAGHDNNLFFQAGLEEVEAVGDGVGKTLQIQPAALVSIGRVFGAREAPTGRR